MNKRFIFVVAFAVVVAGVFTLLFYQLIASKIKSAPAPVATTQVLVASRTLDEGSLIREGDLDVVAWSGTPPPGALQDKKQAIDRGVISKVFQGEPLQESRLAAPGSGAGLSALIPNGKRAVPLRVNDVIGVAGFVVPGQHVDIIILGNPPGSAATLGTISKTLLQNLEVLTAGQDLKKDAEGKPVSVPVITVLATPEQAEALSLANGDTRIQLVLRNKMDDTIVKTPGNAMALLFSGQKLGLPGGQAPVVRRAPPPPPPPAIKAKPPLVIEVIQGGDRKSSEFKQEPED
jgi:pilus assembly protein CpaB